MNEVPNNGPANAVTKAGEVKATATVQVKVNGITIEVTEEVVVKDLLAKAKEAGCIEGTVDEYVIERVTAEGEVPGETTIVVEDDEEFLAVATGPTEVA